MITRQFNFFVNIFLLDELIYTSTYDLKLVPAKMDLYTPDQIALVLRIKHMMMEQITQLYLLLAQNWTHWLLNCLNPLYATQKAKLVGVQLR